MPRSTPAVVRAFAVLRLIGGRGAASSAEIAAALGLPRSTTHELVHTLTELGCLTALPDSSGRYKLGVVLHELGSAYLASVELAREGQEVARTVSARCGETVHVAVLDGADVVYIAKVDSIHSVRMVSAVGRRLPAHCTGVGKALLACLPPPDVRKRYTGSHPLPTMTPASLASLPALERALDRTRRAGIALDACESNPDVCCVAAPVHDYSGAGVAAMSISVPTLRVGDDWPGPLAELVRRGAADLSRRLGYRGETRPLDPTPSPDRTVRPATL